MIILLLRAAPAFADYLGPDRARSETVEVCKAVLLECQYVPSKNTWKYKPVDDWMCNNESKPWLAYPSSGPVCSSGTEGAQYWEKQYHVQTIPITYPEAVISGTLGGCALQNGWCSTSSTLSLSASEPVAGYAIILIEGTRNGESFACEGAACNVPLLEGENAFTFWALSSWGDSSRMGSLNARVDTRPPQIDGTLNGAAGDGGWYVSPVTISASASDPAPGSGLEALTYAWNASADLPYTASLTLGDGVHSVTFRARDRAGHVDEASVNAQVDTLPPQVNAALSGEQRNGWYLSQATFTVSASDTGSGAARIEYALNGGAWQAYAAPVTIGDGIHTLRVRAFDVAGNVGEMAPLIVQVDGAPPHIHLTAVWHIWESGTLDVEDETSGLSKVEIEIYDEQGRWQAVRRVYEADGRSFSTNISWNRQFGEGAFAPVGMYAVIVKAFDRAGNVAQGKAEIHIPAPEVTPSPLPGVSLNIVPTITVLSATVLPNTAPLDTATPAPTRTAVVSSFGSAMLQPSALPSKNLQSTTLQSAALQSKNLQSNNLQSNNPPVHWGAAAVAAIAGAMGLVLAAKRRRKEEEEQQAAEARARAEAQTAALRAKEARQREQAKLQNYLQGKAMLEAQLREAQKAGASQQQVDALRQMGLAKGLGTALAAAAVAIRLLSEKNRAQSENPQPSSSGGKKAMASPVRQPYPDSSTPTDDEPPTFWDKLKQLWDTFWNWVRGKPQPANATPSPTLPPPQVFVTPGPALTNTPSSSSTPIPYQQYKSIGSLTEWELRVGGQVAHNAHQLLAQASQFYFWSNSDPGGNTSPPVPFKYHKNFPIPLDPNLYKQTKYHGSIFEYTNGKIPFVCGDVPDWTYYMAGYNLTSYIPQSDAGYPNRWARSAYAYERMFQLIRLGGIEGKSEIWNIPTRGNNYMFTNQNVPELGDIVVTKTMSDLQNPDANHVVIVAGVHGLSPDQIIIFEGNPDDGTLVAHSLEELKNRIPDIKYIIYSIPSPITG